MKRNYEMPLLTMVAFESTDVITTSTPEVQKPILDNEGKGGVGADTGWGSF